MAKTQIFSAPSTLVIGGVTTTVPDRAIPQDRLPNTANAIEVELTLSDADKLSVGLVIDWGVYVSPDNGATWKFIAGQRWTSYGPGGLTVTDIDGTVRVNPNPRAQIGVVPYRTWHSKGVILPSRNVSLGAIISIR